MRRLPFSRPLSLLGALALTIPLAATGAVTAVAAPAEALTAPATISVPGLTATVAADFPQVIGYQLAGKHLGGRTATVQEVLIDGRPQAVQGVTAQRDDATKVSYQVSLAGGG